MNRVQHSHPSHVEHLHIKEILANMNQRLNQLDKLDEMSSSLKGEINRVQTRVGEVASQVKTDLNRCEEKWEMGTSAMMGRIEKI